MPLPVQNPTMRILPVPAVLMPLFVLCCAVSLALLPAAAPAAAAEPSAAAAGPRADPGAPIVSGTAATVGAAAVATAPTATADRPEEGLVDWMHGSVTRGFLLSALWLDSFFGDERYYTEVQRSYFKMSYQILNETWDWTRYRPDYELRLVLPQLRKQTKLVLTSDFRGYGEDPVSETTTPQPPATQKDRKMDTSLQFFLPAPERHSTSVRAGVKYHSGDIDYYLGPRYRYLLPVGRWSFRFTEDVVWGTVNGWESKTTVDFERIVGRDLFFRASSEGTWTENVNGYNYFTSLLLRQPLDPKRALEYEEINYFHTRPTDELTEVKLVARYRQQFWRQWLYFELAPQLRFPRDSSFHGVPGILFKLDFYIGGTRS